jgi:hypothetical protein
MSIGSSDEGERGSFGVAEVYTAGNTTDIQGMPEWAESKNRGATPILTGTLVKTLDNLRVTVSRVADAIVVRLKVAARQYFPFAEDAWHYCQASKLLVFREISIQLYCWFY